MARLTKAEKRHAKKGAKLAAKRAEKTPTGKKARFAHEQSIGTKVYRSKSGKKVRKKVKKKIKKKR